MLFKGREVKLNTVDHFNNLTDNKYEDVRHVRRTCANIMHCVNNDLILALTLLFTYLYIHSGTSVHLYYRQETSLIRPLYIVGPFCRVYMYHSFAYCITGSMTIAGL